VVIHKRYQLKHWIYRSEYVLELVLESISFAAVFVNFGTLRMNLVDMVASRADKDAAGVVI
jgi:hypothetical protein